MGRPLILKMEREISRQCPAGERNEPIVFRLPFSDSLTALDASRDAAHVPLDHIELNSCLPEHRLESNLRGIQQPREHGGKSTEIGELCQALLNV